MWRLVLFACCIVPGVMADDVEADIWSQWRQPARRDAPLYAHDPAFPAVELAQLLAFPEMAKRLPLIVTPDDLELSDTRGIEVSFRFRVGRTPPARLEKSHSIANFTLQGRGGNRSFWLHAYSRNSGLMLNGLIADGDTIHLARGAARPHTAPHWDTQWHTVTVAWCRGRLAATWDGLPILHLESPAIDFDSCVLEWVRPEHAFATLELGPIISHSIHFRTD